MTRTAPAQPTTAASVITQSRDALTVGLADHPWWAGPRLVAILAPIVGIASGSFSVDTPGRAALMLFAAIKMPILLLATAAFCVPPFFVMHAALGVRRDFPISLRAVLAAQAVTAIVLAALAPLIPVYYTAIDDKSLAVLGCGLCFAAAALCSLLVPARMFRLAGLTTPTHRALVVCWFVLYAFVGIQLGWMLRPFVGSPDIPPAFLRDDPFTNGYVVVFDMLRGLATHPR
jgi:hypothetical protein